MQILLDSEGFFKAEAPPSKKLYRRFCTKCDGDFYTANRHRKHCRVCAGPAQDREVRA